MPNQYTKYKDVIASSEPVQFRWRSCDGNKRVKSRSQRKTTSKGANEACRTDHQRENKDQEAIGSGSRGCALLQYLPSGGLRIDPFRAYPVAPNHSELAVLDHFLNILTPSGQHNEVLLAKRKTVQTDPHINLLLPYVMQEAPLFDALLATCQASMLLSSGLSAYSDRFFMLHRGRAMKGLREQIETSIATSAILAVTMLLTCDYLIGDLRAVTSHAQALQRIADLRGTLPENTPWDKFVRRGVEAYKAIACLAAGLNPNDTGGKTELDDLVDPFVELEYPQPPFSNESCSVWANLPSGFCDLILASQISTQLVSIINALNLIDPEDGLDIIECLKIVQPIQAALQRFAQHKDVTYLERCVAAGLLAYSFQYPGFQVPNMFHDPPLQGFTRLFSIPYRPQSNAERDVLLWAHMVVESISSARSIRLPGSRDVLVKAKKQHGLLRDWSKLTPVLKRFFWTPDLLERWEGCHANNHSLGWTNGSAKSLSLELSLPSTLSITNTPQASQAVCPFSGQASQGSGDDARCPFQPL